MSETRKLAAILVSDIVGYSRLAGADEDGVLARLRTLRSELIDPTIVVHHGRVVKRTGDGSIVEFRSVVDAVRCAIEVQNGMAKRETGLPEDQRIVFRIGVHIGDVVEESDGDLMGEGVNIAARLEGVAKPGAICLSEQAYWQVRGRLDVKVNDLGPTRLKNIAEPIHVYSLDVGAPAASKPARSGGAKTVWTKPFGRLWRWPGVMIILAGAVLVAATYAWRSGLAPRMLGFSVAEDKLATAPHVSLIVLPFANLSGNPDQDYFADAITDDLTTEMSHLGDKSFVIARSTAFTYKGKPIDIKAIGRELGVRYALEGSVSRIGDAISINAQLISTETGAHVWADRFEGERAKLGQLQVDIVARLANTLKVGLWRAEGLRAIRERPENADAVDLARRGEVTFWRFDRDSIKEAIGYLDRALELDPDLVNSKAALADALTANAGIGGSADPRADVERAERLANEALSADPANAYAHYAKAVVYQALISTKLAAPSDQLWEAAISQAETAIDLDPNSAGAHAINGYFRLFVGRADEGVKEVETALRLSPRDPGRPFFEFYLCHLHGHLAQWDQAIEHCRVAAQAIKYWIYQADVVFVSAWLGHDADAKAALIDLLKLRPDLTVKGYKDAAATFSVNPVFAQQIVRMAEGLRKAGLPEQ